MPRPLYICCVFGILCASVYFVSSPRGSYNHLKSYLGMSQPQWSSKFSGYLQRAEQHPHPHSYTPQRDLLTLVGLRNARTEPEGFSLAVFSDRVAIDMKGNTVVLAEADYDGLVGLAKEIGSLPQTGDFRNQWRVQHEITGRPIDRILYAKAPLSASPAPNYDTEFVETSVYGFDKQKLLLQTPVEEYNTLPSCLWELTGLVVEARETEGAQDELVLQRVRSILGNVF